MGFHIAGRAEDKLSKVLGGNQRPSLHTVREDRRPIGYIGSAVGSGLFCNLKGRGITYD